jgi:hypothetical protein
MDTLLYFIALSIGYIMGIATTFIYQSLLRKRQRQAWIQRNPRAHSLLARRLQEEEWSER